MPKHKLTLTVDPVLLEKIKIQAVLDKSSVSNITEEMWREYLKRSTRQRKAVAAYIKYKRTRKKAAP